MRVQATLCWVTFRSRLGSHAECLSQRGLFGNCNELPTIAAESAAIVAPNLEIGYFSGKVDALSLLARGTPRFLRQGVFLFEAHPL